MDYTIKPPNIKRPQDETGKLPKGFNTDILPDPSKGFMLGIVAPRGSGKSVLLYNILKFYDKYIFPISKSLDKLGFKHFLGKNLLIVAKKK